MASAPRGATPPTSRGLSRQLFGRLRAAVSTARSSLTARLATVIVVYAAALALVLAIADSAGDALFVNAFPTMETVLAYQDDLARDRFDVLQGPDLANGKIVVFDEKGTRLYASSEHAAEGIRASYLPFINDYAVSLFYEVFQEETPEGELRYRILQCSSDDQDGSAKRLEAYAVLSSDLTILEGDLFAGRDALTQREFDFIKGVYDARMSVERYDYLTNDGSLRTLVLAAPLVSDAAYARVVDQAGRITLYTVPVVLLISVAAALMLMRCVRGAVRPLDRAIDAYRAGDASLAAGDVPLELVPTYRNFTDLMDRLRAAEHERQRLVADVSHDLKTPLTVIGGYAQAFCDGIVPPEKERAYHRAMRDKARSANQLIETLVFYARMEHPEARFVLERVDLAAFVREVVAGVAPEIERAGAQITCQAEVPLMARIDRQLFQRVLINLIDNACAHNEPGVRIGVAVAPVDTRAVRVTVADTGAGVPAELAARVFEPFVTENTARSPQGGTGLGLAIVRRAVEVMGGRVWLEDAPAAPWSTVFALELPRYPS